MVFMNFLECTLYFIKVLYTINIYLQSYPSRGILNLLYPLFIFVVLKLHLTQHSYYIILYLYFLKISCPRCSSRQFTPLFLYVHNFHGLFIIFISYMCFLWILYYILRYFAFPIFSGIL